MSDSPAAAIRAVRPALVGASARQAPLKILIASHSHPRLSKGGAEIAAYQLFTALLSRPGHESWFLGCVRDPADQKPGVPISQPYSEREYLYFSGGFDWFKFSNGDWSFPREFCTLLQQLQPQIVHFHHYINFGVEAFLHVREVLPDCKIVLTLHEYLALCHHLGQMITRPDRTLCYESSPTRCTDCFKDIAPSDFFLRNLYIRRFFDLVDHFISPSVFLAERYAAWGIPRQRISIIENAIAPTVQTPVAQTGASDSDLLRVGFFGQISSLKGINVLFEAAEIIDQRGLHHVVFEIYGDYSGQASEFQEEFLQRLGRAGRNVRFLGPYEQVRVDRLMRSVDVVLMPSIWWENSPIVIQEALRNRRPVICSDIGGMAEKVRDGLDGFHFPVGNSVALASLLARLAAEPARLKHMSATMQHAPALETILSQHERLYQSLMSRTDGATCLESPAIEATP